MAKKAHGWHHPETTKQNSPIKYAATEDQIRRGELAVTGVMLPRFLYPDGHKYDPNDVLNGVLCGHILARACWHVYLGPSTAIKNTESTHKGGNADIAGLCSMTPEMIAPDFLLSVGSWDNSDGLFRYSKFFNHVVGLFDDPVDRVSHIEYFNCIVFGAPEGLVAPQALAHGGGNNFELAKQQRANKRVCLMAEAAATTVGGDENDLNMVN
ncbi:hypothetical protein DXG01_006973 [Tephrocybe rancida]|nr:hypothetical protein DXG01_006973 [Tephrocybe rancida]